MPDPNHPFREDPKLREGEDVDFKMPPPLPRGFRPIVLGVVLLVLGLGATVWSYLSQSGGYLIFTGFIVTGIASIGQGLLSRFTGIGRREEDHEHDAGGRRR